MAATVLRSSKYKYILLMGEEHRTQVRCSSAEDLKSATDIAEFVDEEQAVACIAFGADGIEVLPLSGTATPGRPHILVKWAAPFTISGRVLNDCENNQVISHALANGTRVVLNAHSKPWWADNTNDPLETVTESFAS